MLPPNLPSVAHARIPATYAAAKTALAECSRIDECKTWADKMEALASYAKQTDDNALRQMADRIQARAIRRCGELLRAIMPAPGGRPSKPVPAAAQVSRNQAARDAGLSPRQKNTALRVANIPVYEFEEAVESDDPPTITELAERGKKPAPNPLAHLRGRDPEEFKLSTQVQGQFRSFAGFLDDADPPTAIRGAFEKERNVMTEYGKQISRWIDKLIRHIEKEGRE
jgi:hypothetical protein